MLVDLYVNGRYNEIAFNDQVISKAGNEEVVKKLTFDPKQNKE